MPSSVTASSSIDVAGIVSQLMQVERQPLQQMQTESRKIDTKISAYGKLQSQLAAFRDAAAELSRPTAWRAVKAASADATSVDAVASAGAGAGQYALEVSQLAQPQTVASAALAGASTVIGGGTLRIQLGSQPSGPDSFAPDGNRAEVAVTVAPGATLAEVRDAINSANAGVRASIASDGGQVRLFLGSATSGGTQAFRVQVSDDDGNGTDTAGLSALAFDPTAASGTGRNLSLVKAAADARYSIDGVTLTARSNRIAGALDGLDLTLRKVTAAPVLVEVQTDSEALKASAEKFVKTYNELNALVAEQTRYDPASKAAGPLQGDRSAIGIQSRIREILRDTMTGGTYARLSEVGIETQRDGSLKLNATGFQSATTDPTRLERLFAYDSPTATQSQKGFAVRLRELGDELLGADGAVSTATSSWQTRKTANQKRQDAFNSRLTDVEKRLLRQYSQLDAQLGSMQQASTQLAGQLANLPGSKT